MKIVDLFENKGFSDKALIDIARKAGEKLYGSSHTGLVFKDHVKRMTYADYLAQEDDDSGKATVDTYDYVFFPSTGKGVDAADDFLTKKHVDKDGNIYLGGSEGVTVLSDPFKKGDAKGFDDSEFEPFKKLLFKKFPNAKLSEPDRWNRVFARDGDTLVGQYASRVEHTNNQPGWLVYDHKKTYGSHNW